MPLATSVVTTALDSPHRFPTVQTLAIGAVLLLLRVPYVLAGHIQEDAFITWRVVRVLAEHGTYGFNPGETVSASSSHAYVLLGLLVKLLAGARFIPAMMVVNGVLLLAAIWMLASAIVADPTRRRLLWVCASVLPVGLQVSYSGMETSLLVFLLAALVAGSAGSERPSRWTLAAVALLPWTRPDAIVWPVLWAGALLRRHRRAAITILLYTLAAAIAAIGFNLSLFGTALNQTVVAKHVASDRVFDLATIVARLQYVFLGEAASNAPGAFLPVASRYLIVSGPLALIVVLGAVAYWLRRVWHVPRQRDTFIGLAGFVVVPPAAYAIGGVVFPWYMWPSNLIGSMLVLAAIIDLAADRAPRPRRLILALSGAGLASLAVAQFALAFHWGDVQGRFLTVVGRYLRDVARPEDTLLLEPAGYVPYYSGLHTDDEVGLVSPKVTMYMRTEGPGWWVQFVKRERPTFLVERPHLRTFTTYGRYPLTADERRWFVEHYERVRTFRYDPAAYHEDRRVVRFLRWSAGHPDELDLYRRVDSASPLELGR